MCMVDCCEDNGENEAAGNGPKSTALLAVLYPCVQNPC
jgi:hypothetical protein